MHLFALLLVSGCYIFAQTHPQEPAERVPTSAYKSGQTPTEAMRAMSLPPGFKISLVAGEPKIVQPIAMCFDERGRLWVVEGMAYPKKRPEGQGRDRILILEDEKKDGTYTKITVFKEGLNLVSGIEVGYGGVWIGAAPELLYIPKDAEDKPGEPVVLLDGWGFHDTHETLNSFIWGPDGWLYGNHGVFTHSTVGKPGDTPDQRKKINAGVWRYHPTRHIFEVFAEGTSNPWGLDYDFHGEFFNTACVIPHLYHILPGGRYQRQAGQHFNPYTFDDIKTIADHAHYAGGRVHRPDALKVPESTDAAGGGHAHSGLAIYNGDNFPPEYRGMLIFGNLHGHRLVSDYVSAVGSGFVGKHGNDFLRSNDSAFIPVSQRIGPDGALYVSDWSDVQVCHNNTQEIWDRTNGRIYRISYGMPMNRSRDLTRIPDDELVEIALADSNEYFVRQARKVLSQRELLDKHLIPNSVIHSLQVTLKGDLNPIRRLRALWVLQSTNRLDDAHLVVALKDTESVVRGWAVRLIAQQWKKGIPALVELAKSEISSRVRRELASALSYIPLDQRLSIAKPLLSRSEDALDANIPFLLWYGIEPLIGVDAATGLELTANCRIPRITDYIYRRLASESSSRAKVLALAQSENNAELRAILVARVVEGVRQGGAFEVPVGWVPLVAELRKGASPELEANLNELDALAGNESSRAYFRVHLADMKASLPSRQRALAVLVASRDRAAAPIIHKIFSEKITHGFMRALIQALGTIGDTDSPDVLIQRFSLFTSEQVVEAVAALSCNAEGGNALLSAVATGKVEKKLLSPLVVRQLKSLGDTNVDSQLASIVGVVNSAKADFEKIKKKYESILKPEVIRKGNIAAGRIQFMSSCGICHTFGYIGNPVGPGLAGSNIGKLDYFLENVLNPNGVIGKDYQLNQFKLNSGATMSGIVQFEDAQSFRLAMPGGVKFIVSKGEIQKRETLSTSLMPEGLLESLTKDQLINLVAYLQYPDGFPDTSPGVWRLDGAIEGESLKVKAVTGGKISGQKMSSFKSSRWSGNDHLWWTGGKVGDTLTLLLSIPAEGKYEVKLVCTKAHDYGAFELRLDGKLLEAERYDFYHPAEVVTSGELNGGIHSLEAGEHRLEVKILTPNPAATPRNLFGLDYLKLDKK